MREPFDPSAYPTFDSLPLAKQSEFQPIDERGNFVRRSAIANPNDAQTAAQAINLAETGEITYRQGGRDYGSEYDLEVYFNGTPHTVWLKESVRRLMGSKILTTDLRAAIERTKPGHLAVENKVGPPHYQITADDLESWAERAAIELARIKDAKKLSRRRESEDWRVTIGSEKIINGYESSTAEESLVKQRVAAIRAELFGKKQPKDSTASDGFYL